MRLPSGLASGGVRHREAVLRPLTGREEESLTAGAGISRAAQVTALLAACVERIGAVRPDAGHIRALTIGDREVLLLQLRRATLGDPIDCVMACPAPSCGERLDVRLRTEELLLPAYDDPREWYEDEPVTRAGRRRVRFRLPSGADQEAVAELAATDPGAAALRLLERCLTADDGVDGDGMPRLEPELASRLAARMAALDPQAELLLDLTCPCCSARFDALLDTATFFMAELAAASRGLYEEIHTLACWYHWGESEILGLPTPKRRRYLELIAARAPAAAGAGAA